MGSARERAAAPVRVGAFELRAQTFRGRPEALRVAPDGGVVLTLTFGDTHTIASTRDGGTFTARPAAGTLPGTRVDRRLAADGSGATTTLFASRLLARTFDAAGREQSATPLPGRYVPGTAQLSVAPDGSALLGWQQATGPGTFAARVSVRRPGRRFGRGRTVGRGELTLQAGPRGDGLVVLRTPAGGRVWTVRAGRLGRPGVLPASVTDVALAVGSDGTAVLAQTRAAGRPGGRTSLWAGIARADGAQPPVARRLDAQAEAASALGAAVGPDGAVTVAWGHGGATLVHDGPGLRRRTRVRLAPERLRLIAGPDGRVALLDERGSRVGVAVRAGARPAFVVLDDLGQGGALGPADLTPDGLLITRSVASTATAPSRTEVLRLRPAT